MEQRRHGETPTTVYIMVRLVDREIRNKCLSFKQLGDFKIVVFSMLLSTR